MSGQKRGATSPPSKESKKPKEGDCVVCCEAATDDALECVWCDGPVHAKCVKMSEEQIIMLGNANNIVFFCNTCLNTLPIALKCYDDWASIGSRITIVEESFTELQKTGNQLTTVNNEFKQLSEQHKEVVNQITDLTARINQLVSHSNQMQTRIEDINVALRKKPDAELAQQSTSSTISQPVTNNAYDVIEEMRDRERRRRNIVVYNFSEGADRKADIEAFKALSNTVFKLDLSVSKAVRLGPKIDNKIRPLLLVLEDFDDKNFLISHSHFLKRHDDYNRVFIVPDRSKIERLKHKQAIDELKQRRAKGETALVIRNGVVVKRRSQQTVATPHGSDQSS